MSGLLALLDDVAAIAKVAATNLDDIAAAASKAGAKTAGVVIDDAAVTPKYLDGFAPKRELPVIWRIARGSLFNKLIILLPIALLLSTYAPWLITPLLMLGGSYLCFEGAEKIFHVLFPHGNKEIEADMAVKDPGHLEEQKVRGAIKTDFILSAEIMTIALSAIPESTLWMEAAALALVGAGVTIAVYGAVALIVKMDDVGLYIAQNSDNSATQSLGRGLVTAMPRVMQALSIIGTAAMLWVGGSIIVHGLHDLGIHHPYKDIKDIAYAVSKNVGEAAAPAIKWTTTAVADGILGLIYGLILIPIVTKILSPIIGLFTGRKASH